MAPPIFCIYVIVYSCEVFSEWDWRPVEGVFAHLATLQLITRFPLPVVLHGQRKKVIKLIITYTNIDNRVYITFKELTGECGRICHSTGIEAALKEAIGGHKHGCCHFPTFNSPSFVFVKLALSATALHASTSPLKGVCLTKSRACTSSSLFVPCSHPRKLNLISKLIFFVLSEGNRRAYYLNFTARVYY